MAIGDDALGAGYTLVPSSGEEGRVRWGSREINRTRDFIAQVKTLLSQHTHLGPDITFVYQSTVSGNSGVTVVPAVTLPAVPYNTRVFVDASGQAGFNGSEMDVALRISSNRTSDQQIEGLVKAQGARWTTVVRSGYVDIAANTTAMIWIQGICASNAGTTYFRTAMKLTRSHVA